MQRRKFFKYATAGLASTFGVGGLLAWQPRAHAATVSQTFYLTQGMKLQPDGTQVFFRGFSTAANVVDVPAKSLIVQQGDTVTITINNNLGTTHRFVIDGMVDSGPIAGGSIKTFSFTAGTPGSYLFYDKENAPYNRVLGLHGGLAIMPTGSANQSYSGAPTFKKQLFWILNDIDPVWHGNLRNGITPSSAFVPRYFTINGLSSRPPGAAGYSDAKINAMYDPRSKLSGMIGDRTLIRILNAGMCRHSLHWHANHVEWLTSNGQIRPDIWLKDIIGVANNMGKADVIFPFKAPPDAHPPVTMGHYVMHLHDEMTQTAGGGMYQFGAATGIEFK